MREEIGVSSNVIEHESDTEHTFKDGAESEYSMEQSQSADITPTKKRPSTHMLTPQGAKLLKRRKQLSNRFDNTVNKLQHIAQLTSEDTEDQYDIFGKHLASQLRDLPLRSFILLQSKIQNLITEERLNNLNNSNIVQSTTITKSYEE